MEELQEFSEKEESNFDLKAEFYKYLVHWKWLVFGSLLGLLIAFLYNRYTTPEYWTQSSMMILKEDQNIASALPSGGPSLLAVDNSSLENQIETIRSKRLIGNVVDELNFNVSYFNAGNVIDVEAYKNSSVVIEFLSPDSIVHQTFRSFFVTPQSATSFQLVDEYSGYSKTHKFGEMVNLDGLDFTILPRGTELENFNTVNIQIHPLEQVVSNIISRLAIARKGNAQDILSLSYKGEVTEKSEDFLNALMRHFNLDGMEDKRQIEENTSVFIQERLRLISEELDSVEGGMADFKRQNQIMDVSSGAGRYMEQSSMAMQEVFDLETQLMVIRSVQDALTSSEPYRLLPANMVGTEEGGISELIGNYNTLVLERNTYLRSSTPRNPVVATITEQLDSLRENLLDNIEGTIDNINIRRQELNQLELRAEGQFSTFPGLEKGIRSIQRQQQIKEQLYLFLLERREESAIAHAATSPVAKVIDAAFTENSPVNPEPWVVLMGGFFGGLLIPLFVLFGRNYLDTKVHHKGDLNQVTRTIPFVGEIPKISGEANEAIQLNDRSPLAESFRILRTNLAYLVQSRNNEKGQIIFITSTIKGEGKTFTSYNLARTLASTNKKVLLVGADIRNPQLHKFSDAPVGAKGLSDFLYNFDINSSKIIQPTNQGDIPVDIILSGAIPPNPAELFMNNRMEELLRTEEKNYDYIIVDTAPTMIVTDTLLISPLADTTLYVTRAGFTDKKLLEFPKELKQQGKLKGVAIVLNDVDYSKFSYGAKYGYAYGYGYGYGADKEKRPFFARLFRKKKA